MRKYRLSTMAFILCVMLLFTDTLRSYADSISGNGAGGSDEPGAVSDNESGNGESGSASGNGVVPENGSGSASGNEPGSVSEDQIYEIVISCNLVSKTKRKVGILISAESKGSGVALIQAENERAGIRKTIYKIADKDIDPVRPSEDGNDDAVDVKFTLTANGSYIFYAYDEKGNMDLMRLSVSDIERRDISAYLELAERNRMESETGTYDDSQNEDGAYTLKLGTAYIGGGGTDTDSDREKAYRSGQGYIVRSGDGSGTDTETAASGKYKDWSMLRNREKRSDFRAWYEPYALSGDNIKPQPLENVLDLSDYETDLFNADYREEEEEGEGEGVLGESASPYEDGDKGGFLDLKFSRPDDNIESMNDSNRIIIIGIIIFIIILVMMLTAFMLMRGAKEKNVKVRVKKGSGRKGTGKASGSSGKARPKARSKSAAPVKSNKTGSSKGKTQAKAKSGVSAKAPSASGKGVSGGMTGNVGKTPASNGLTDDGIEKYAKMTMEYARSKLGIELDRVSLKKYYSERHGFDCVDFTYRLPEGTATSQFKPHLNDVDTALTNVSGKDTITFPMGNDTGVYKTTFYLNK